MATEAVLPPPSSFEEEMGERGGERE